MASVETMTLKMERLEVKNFRVLRDVTISHWSPLMVFIGANGSGKSTIFDVFAFLHEAFDGGLRGAWDRRGGMQGIRTKGHTGPIEITLTYRDDASRVVTYSLAIGEHSGQPVIEKETLRWATSPGSGKPQYILDFAMGKGRVWDEVTGTELAEEFNQPWYLAVSSIGKFAQHRTIVALEQFIQGWYLSYVSADHTRAEAIAGAQRTLNRTGDNLANVVQYYEEQHPEALAKIFTTLKKWVPELEAITSEKTVDGRLVLLLKDKPFDDPILSRYTSDGTLKLMAYLALLNNPVMPTVLGVEEPENQLHPKLLAILAEEFQQAAEHSQILVTTHSTEFIQPLDPSQLWYVHRNDHGFAEITQVSTLPLVADQVAQGTSLSTLWRENWIVGEGPRL